MAGKSYEIQISSKGAEALARAAQSTQQSLRQAEQSAKGVEESSKRAAGGLSIFSSEDKRNLRILSQRNETSYQSMFPAHERRALNILAQRHDVTRQRIFNQDDLRALSGEEAGGGGGGMGTTTLLRSLHRLTESISRGNLGEALIPIARIATAAGGAEGAAAGLAGIAAASGPAIVGITAATAGFTALVAVVRSTADSLRNLNAAAAIGGPGTGGRIAGLGAFGLSPEAAAGLAGQLRGRLGSDPMAIAFGGFVPGMPFGPTDNIRLLQREIQQLRALQGNPDAQFRRASVLGLQSLLPGVNVSPVVQRQQDAAFRIQGQVFDEKSLAVGRDFNAELAITSSLFADMTAELGKPAMAEFTSSLKDLNDALAAGIPYMKQEAGYLAFLSKAAALSNPVTGIPALLGDIWHFLRGDNALKRHADAMDRHSRSMDADAALYRGLPRGPRSAHALSAAQAAEIYRRGVEGTAIGAGAHRI